VLGVSIQLAVGVTVSDICAHVYVLGTIIKRFQGHF